MPPRGWSSALTFRSWLLRGASGKLCASGPPWWSWCIWGLQSNPQWIAFDLGPLDILPVHVGLAVERLDDGDDGISTEEFFELVRLWQQGRRPWREPWSSLVGTPGLPREVANAGRAIRAILGAVAYDVEYVPPLCILCRLPTFESCRVCRSIVCESCNFWSRQCPLCVDSSGSD